MEKEQKLSAFVFGYSGAIGSSIVRALAAEPKFNKVTLFGRREINLKKHCPESNENFDFTKFTQEIIDFEKLLEYSDKLRGFDVGFSALGGWLMQNKKAFRKIEYEYSLTIAKLASKAGCKHFHYTSGVCVYENNIWFPIIQSKVEMENIFRQNSGDVKFPRVSIYRPGTVITDVEHGGAVGKFLVTLFRTLDPQRWYSVKGNLLGEFMVQNTFNQIMEGDKGVEIFSNADINAWGKKWKSRNGEISTGFGLRFLIILIIISVFVSISASIIIS